MKGKDVLNVLCILLVTGASAFAIVAVWQTWEFSSVQTIHSEPLTNLHFENVIFNRADGMAKNITFGIKNIGKTTANIESVSVNGAPVEVVGTKMIAVGTTQNFTYVVMWTNSTEYRIRVTTDNGFIRGASYCSPPLNGTLPEDSNATAI